MNPYILTGGIIILAIIIAYNLSDDDLALISTSINQLGNNLETIAVQKAILRRRENAADNVLFGNLFSQNIL